MGVGVERELIGQLRGKDLVDRYSFSGLLWLRSAERDVICVVEA
jgi:hypothetical protein